MVGPLTTPDSPVTDAVAGELRRVQDRWRVLPLDRALAYSPAVRELVQRLADTAARSDGVPVSTVPDLGPATLLDQLAVVVHDCAAAGVARGMAGDLADLRRSLS